MDPGWNLRSGVLVVSTAETVYLLPADAESPVVLEGLTAEVWRQASSVGPTAAATLLAADYDVSTSQVMADMERVRADLEGLGVLEVGDGRAQR